MSTQDSRKGGSGRATAHTPATARRTIPPSRECGEAALADLGAGWTTTPIGRRALLGRAAALVVTVAAGTNLACLRRPSRAQVARAATGLDEPPWPTLTAAHDHLFPDDGNGPSARDIHATAYLRALLDDPDFDADDADFIRRGAGWLDDLAVKRERAPFAALAPGARDRVMVEVAASGPGERWLSLLLTYLFEALLADPIYGGNPDGIGWQWLDHQPGFPQPTADQTYQKLRKA